MRPPSTGRAVRLLAALALLGLVSASPDAAVHTDSVRAAPAPAGPPPLDTPPSPTANLLLTLLARGAVFDPSAGTLTLQAAFPVATVLSQTPVPHAARLPAARLANATAWSSNGTWLNSPHAVLEGTPEGGGKGVVLALRLSRPAVVSPSPLTLRFDAVPAAADGDGALVGGVVTYALAAAADAGAVSAAAAASPGPPPAAAAPPRRPLALSDVALFIDASLAGGEASEQGHQKQTSAYYGCYSSSLGSLAVFGSNCGGSEDWQYDPFTAGGSQYVG